MVCDKVGVWQSWCVKDGVWQSCVNEMVCDKVGVWKMVWVRWCVWDGVWARCCVKKNGAAEAGYRIKNRPTGNRAWRRWHLWISSLIQKASNVRLWHTSILFLGSFSWQFHGVICFYRFVLVKCCFFCFVRKTIGAATSACESFSHACKSKSVYGSAKQRFLYSFGCFVQHVFTQDFVQQWC